MDNLSNLAQYQSGVNTGNSAANGKVTTTNTAPAQNQSTSGTQQNVEQLKAGDTISGQVVESDGSNVKIAINENYVIQAKLEQDLSLISGRNMLFEVKGNTGSQVSLSPLFANLAGETNAQKALSAASLPINQNTMKMVAALMEQGMSIDKSTLSQIYRQSIQNPDASQNAILQLHKMEVPVNADNLQQLDLYMNYKHQLLQGIEDVAGQIPELYEAMTNAGDTVKANQFMGELLQIFTETGPAAEGVILAGGETVLPEDGLPVPGETAQTAGDAVNAAQVEHANSQDMPMETVQGQAGTDGNMIAAEVAGKVAEEILQAMQGEDMVSVTAEKLVNGENGIENILTNGNGVQAAAQEQSAVSQLSASQATEIANAMKEMGISQEALQQFADGSMSGQQLLKLISQSLSNPTELATATQLIRSEGFQKLFQSEVARQWLLQPEDVKKEGTVDRFYEHLREQTGKMSQMLEQAGQGSSSLAKSVQNIRSNVNFMNDLNHMFTYVQLPLKFSEGNAHGDLYVYTNKKSLARETGEVSALLHLDMEHLGQLDVHVSLSMGERVSTKFYVADDETLDFISEHIDMLNERLESRGYQASTNFEVRNQPQNVMKEMIDAGNKPTLLATQSFDARA